MNMTDTEKDYFRSVIEGKKYLEYGCGESTEIAEQVCTEITSIETDPEWAKKYGAIHVDFGQVGGWGRPINPPCADTLSEYFSYAKDYEIMLIDGRYRVGVAYNAAPGMILIHDYNREQYHVVEKFMKKIEQVETLALFEKKRNTVPFEKIIDML